MNTSSTVTNWNDPKVKELMVASKYRKEQELTTNEAIKACDNKNLAVELYAGTGGLTEIYGKEFDEVVTNDINKNANTFYHMKAMKFIEDILSLESDNIIGKINLIDFDCYGCPALEIQKFFEVRHNVDAPFVLRFSDGLGLWMKRNKKEDVIRKRYLIEGPIVMERIWDRHSELIDYFMKKIAGQYGMKAEKIISVVTKHKNYVLGCYKFTNI